MPNSFICTAIVHRLGWDGSALAVVPERFLSRELPQNVLLRRRRWSSACCPLLVVLCLLSNLRLAVRCRSGCSGGTIGNHGARESNSHSLCCSLHTVKGGELTGCTSTLAAPQITF